MIIKLEAGIMLRHTRILKLEKQGFRIVAIEENSIVLSNDKSP